MDTVSSKSAAVHGCHVAVFTGGEDPPPLRVKQVLDDATLVIAADSGLHLAVDWAIKVNHVVGDMDSVNPVLLEQARALGATVTTHPEAKNHTDLELAVAEAQRLGATKITVIGGAAGRLDHLFGTALMLTAQRFASISLQAFLGVSTLTVVRSSATLHGQVGELVGLFAMQGVANGVTTTGLRYRLDDESLAAGSTRGVSNMFVNPTAQVRLRDGVLLSVQSGVIAQ